MKPVTKYSILVGVNAVYACEAVCNKYASMHAFMSMQYMLGIAAAVVVLGIYAITWQQILKRIPLTDAYMFKGTSLVFVLLFSVLIFQEIVTVWNLVGLAIILVGTVGYARADHSHNDGMSRSAK